MSHRLHAENLREAAARRGDLTDYRIAKRSSIPKTTLSRLVNGHGEPTVTTLVLLAACYGMTIESLIRKVEPPALAAA